MFSFKENKEINTRGFFKNNIPLSFEASNTAVVITPAATINVAITRTSSHIFRLDGLLTGMCSQFFSMSYIYNIKKNNKDQ